MGNAAVADVWVDEGYGRIGIVADAGLGMHDVLVSCDDGRVIRVYLDPLYTPRTKTALAVVPGYELEDGQRVFFRAETGRLAGTPADVSIRDLDDDQVHRTFVTLATIEDGVDEPADRPAPRTQPVKNEDTPAPAPRRRELPFRDTWAYAGAMGCATHAYTDSPEGATFVEIYEQAKGVMAAADLVQLTLEHRVDRSKYSHTRIRSAAHVVAGRNPLPADVDDASKRGWLVGVALTTRELCFMADALWRTPETWCRL